MAVLTSRETDGYITTFCLMKVEKHLGPFILTGELDGNYLLSIISYAVINVP